MSAIVFFVGSYPTFVQLFSDASNARVMIVDEAMTGVYSKVDEFVDEITGHVEKVKEAINDGLEPIKPKLKNARKNVKTLQEVDPDIVIPNDADIDDDMTYVTDKIDDGVTTVKDYVDYDEEFGSNKGLGTSNEIPDERVIEGVLEGTEDDLVGFAKTFKETLNPFKYFSTPEVFNKRVVYPLLALFLIFQLLVVHYMAGSCSTYNDDIVVEDNRALKYNKYLRGLVDSSSGESGYASFIRSLPCAFTVVICSFLVAVIEILVSFVASRKITIGSIINIRIFMINADVNNTFRPILRDVLVTKMKILKGKVLDLIDAVEKIDQIQAQFRSALVYYGTGY